MRPKRIPKTILVGQQGVNLIERIVHNMGFVWRPTPHMDSGVDGHIEIRNPNTGDMSNLILAVQSKATESSWMSETASSFTFTVDERDLSYWLQGNLPVVLVVSRPSSDEAYWISVKDYFANSVRQRERRVYFNKDRNRFAPEIADQLIQLAAPNKGVYLGPLRKQETLESNLLPISFPIPFFYQAITPIRDAKEVYERINAKLDEWVLRSGMIYSFHPLREAPWDSVCDPGTAERRDIDEWASSDDPDIQRNFVQLLGGALSTLFRGRKVYWHREQKFHYFGANEPKPQRSEGNETSGQLRRVVQQYNEGTDRAYCRHYALKSRFVRYDKQWYLEITPTYYFTRDGHIELKTYQGLLKGIKRIEKHPAVKGLHRFWSQYLFREPDLINPEFAYPFLKFHPPIQLELNIGIADKAWRNPREDELANLSDAADALYEDDVADDEGLIQGELWS